MSRTTMYAFHENGPWSQAAEFSNSWGSGYFIWDALRKKYLPKDADKYLFAPGVIDKVWDLGKEGSGATTSERAVLMTTFDYALAPKECFKELAEAFRAFKEEHHKSAVVCSLDGQADVLDKLAADPSVVAVGWQQTSVSENLWWVQDPDNEDDEGRPYDLAKDDKHWFIAERKSS